MLRQPCLLTADTTDFEELAQAYRKAFPWTVLVPVTLLYWLAATLTQQALGSTPQSWQHAGYALQAPLLMGWGNWLHRNCFNSRLRLSAFNALMALALGPLSGVLGFFAAQTL